MKRAKTENIPMPLHQQPLQFPPQTLQQQEQMHQLQMSLQHQHMQALQQRQQHMQQHPNPNNLLPVSSPQQPLIPQQPQASTPINIAQPNTQPVFKTPAMPVTPGLQIPSKANAPLLTR